MIPDRIGIIGSTQGVNASSRPKPRKLASTTQKLPDWNSAATSRSVAQSEKRGCGSTENGAGVRPGPPPCARIDEPEPS